MQAAREFSAPENAIAYVWLRMLQECRRASPADFTRENTCLEAPPFPVRPGCLPDTNSVATWSPTR